MDLVDFSFLVQLKEIEIRYVDLNSMERLRVEKWVEKLMQIRQASHERNEYVRLLLAMVAEKKLSYPFHIPPDPGPLPLPPLPNRLHSKFKNIMGAHESVFWGGVYSQLMPPEAYSYHELELQIESDKVIIKELKDRLAVLEGTCERIAAHCRDHRTSEEAPDLDLDVEQRNRLKWVESTMSHYNAYKAIYEKLLDSVIQTTTENIGASASNMTKAVRTSNAAIISLNQCPPRAPRHPLKAPLQPTLAVVTNGVSPGGDHHPGRPHPIIFSPHHNYPRRGDESSRLQTLQDSRRSDLGSGVDQASVLEFIYKHKEDQVKEMEDYVIAMEHRHCELDRSLREDINRQRDKFIEHIQNLEEKEREKDQRYLDAFGTIRRLQDENRSLRDTNAHNEVYIDTLLSRIDDLTKLSELKATDEHSLRHLEDWFVHSLEQICAAGAPPTVRGAGGRWGGGSDGAASLSSGGGKGGHRPASSSAAGVGRAARGSSATADAAAASVGNGGGRLRTYTKPRVPTRAERLVEKRKKADDDLRRAREGTGQGNHRARSLSPTKVRHTDTTGVSSTSSTTERPREPCFSTFLTMAAPPPALSSPTGSRLPPSASRSSSLPVPAMAVHCHSSGDNGMHCVADAGSDGGDTRKKRVSLPSSHASREVVEAPLPERRGPAGWGKNATGGRTEDS